MNHGLPLSARIIPYFFNAVRITRLRAENPAMLRMLSIEDANPSEEATDLSIGLHDDVPDIYEGYGCVTP
jgi:hypothetical protein